MTGAAAFPPRQLPLPLPHTESHDPADLLEDASNREALAWLRRPEGWPNGRLALAGPPATGKTHMLRGFAAERGWPVLDGAAAARPAGGAAAGAAGLALDDADCAPDEAALLHLLNICAERRQALLLAGREPPARWPVALPDLRSRLRATAVATVRPPEDALLAALLRKHFADRQLRLDPALAAWLLPRLPREAAAVAEAAARLDRAALASGGRVTRSLAAVVLRGTPGFGSAGAADDDGIVATGEAASTSPRLL